MIGDIIELNIDSLVSGGKGIARASSGKAVFVPGVIPGEVVSARIIKEHASYIEVIPEKILSESEIRIKPCCVLFEKCGGCDWQYIGYPQQVKFKEAILQSHLRKLIKADTPVHFTPVESPVIYGYRNQIHLHFSNKTAGFYMKGSHSIVEVNDCMIAKSKIRDMLPFIIELLYNKFIIRPVSLEVLCINSSIQLVIHARGTIGRKVYNDVSRLCELVDVSGAVIINDVSHKQHTIGDGCFSYTIKADERVFTIRGGLGGFIQANQFVNQLMVQHVLNLMRGSSKVIDLYSGCGNFTIPLASLCDEITAIDHDRRLLSFVSENASDNGLNNVNAIESKVSERMSRLPVIKKGADTIILDPPRAGAKELVGVVERIKPEKIIYVSCDPSTLSRDLDSLRISGYKLKTYRVFDMFPQTHHIETVVSLEQ